MSLIHDENTVWEDKVGQKITVGRRFRYFDENERLVGEDIVKGPIFEEETKYHPNEEDMIVVKVKCTEGSNGLVVPNNRLEII